LVKGFEGILRRKKRRNPIQINELYKPYVVRWNKSWVAAEASMKALGIFSFRALI